MILPRILVLAGLSALTSCQLPLPETVRADARELPSPTVRLKLDCPYRFAEPVDARPSDESGRLGLNDYRLAEVAALVRMHLDAIEIAGPVTNTTPTVTLRVLKTYIDEVYDTTQIPVVVYEARINDRTPAVIRSQLTSMVWHTGSESALKTFANAFDDADSKLVDLLNRMCPRN